MLFKKRTRMIFVVVGFMKEPEEYTRKEYQPLILGICKDFDNAQKLVNTSASTGLYAKVCIQYTPSDL